MNRRGFLKRMLIVGVGVCVLPLLSKIELIVPVKWDKKILTLMDMLKRDMERSIMFGEVQEPTEFQGLTCLIEESLNKENELLKNIPWKGV
jgi:hypothetical protein